jgi:hypothetical protein
MCLGVISNATLTEATKRFNSSCVKGVHMDTHLPQAQSIITLKQTNGHTLSFRLLAQRQALMWDMA